MDVSLKDLKELLCCQPATSASHPYNIGSDYFIRTVTHHYTGKLIAVYPQELVLLDAAWIADDGRFSDAVSRGLFNEIEPWPENVEVVIGRNTIIDASIVAFPLPRSRK